MGASALTLIAVVLLAPPVAPTKATKLEQGQRLFSLGEFEAALKVLDAAAAEGGDPTTLERVHLLRAQCLGARQDFTRAEEAFAAALEANPDTSLDPARVDPTLVKLLEAVRERLAATVIVDSTPAGAALGLDGRDAGAAPVTLQVAVGTHLVTARFGAQEPVAQELVLRPRREARVHFVQAPAPPPEKIAAPPPSAPQGRPLRPLVDVRGSLEVPAAMAAVRGGFDLGGGLEVSYFRVSLLARLFPSFGLSLRGALVMPIKSWLSAFVELWVPWWFKARGMDLGVGGAAGAEFHLTPWLGLHASLGAQHLFLLNPDQNDGTHLVLSGGLRFRYP